MMQAKQRSPLAPARGIRRLARSNATEPGPCCESAAAVRSSRMSEMATMLARHPFHGCRQGGFQPRPRLSREAGGAGTVGALAKVRGEGGHRVLANAPTEGRRTCQGAGIGEPRSGERAYEIIA